MNEQRAGCCYQPAAAVAANSLEFLRSTSDHHQKQEQSQQYRYAANNADTGQAYNRFNEYSSCTAGYPSCTSAETHSAYSTRWPARSQTTSTSIASSDAPSSFSSDPYPNQFSLRSALTQQHPEAPSQDAGYDLQSGASWGQAVQHQPMNHLQFDYDTGSGISAQSHAAPRALVDYDVGSGISTQPQGRSFHDQLARQTDGPSSWQVDPRSYSRHQWGATASDASTDYLHRSKRMRGDSVTEDASAVYVYAADETALGRARGAATWALGLSSAATQAQARVSSIEIREHNLQLSRQLEGTRTFERGGCGEPQHSSQCPTTISMGHARSKVRKSHTTGPDDDYISDPGCGPVRKAAPAPTRKCQSWTFWTAEEHALFIQGLELFAPSDAHSIASHVGTRTVKQVRVCACVCLRACVHVLARVSFCVRERLYV